MPKTLSCYVNTRARLQRLKDAKFVSGWVTSFDGVVVKVRLAQSNICDPGDRFLVEIFGIEYVATFQAQVTLSCDNQATLAAFTDVIQKPTTENPRICVGDVFGMLTFNGQNHECRVIDVSKGGLGVTVRTLLGRKENVKLKLSGPSGEIVAEAEVRYCRPDPAVPGSFRAGLLLGEMARLEKAKWLRLLEADAQSKSA